MKVLLITVSVLYYLLCKYMNVSGLDLVGKMVRGLFFKSNGEETCKRCSILKGLLLVLIFVLCLKAYIYIYI